MLPTAAAADSPTRLPSFSATYMTGAAEVPGPGDPDGSGVAYVNWDADDGIVCYKLLVRKIAPAVAAHIHVGGKNVAGPVVQELKAPVLGYSAGCVNNAPLAAALDANPDNYYVNVHNARYPAGALRGQLH
jgi:hypothetical protein